MGEPIELRDGDGFIRILPNGERVESDDRSLTARAKISTIFGEYMFTKTVDPITRRYSKSSLSISEDLPYQPVHRDKSWQSKAWNLIGDMVDWTRASPFRKIGTTTKMRHVLLIGLSMKVRANAGKLDRPTFDELVPSTPLKAYPTSGIYAIINDQRTFEYWVLKMYSMFKDDAKISNYLNRARKHGFHSIDFIMKAFIVYDDKSYDALIGNPYQLEDTLGIALSDDNHTINWRKPK